MKRRLKNEDFEDLNDVDNRIRLQPRRASRDYHVQRLVKQATEDRNESYRDLSPQRLFRNRNAFNRVRIKLESDGQS